MNRFTSLIVVSLFVFGVGPDRAGASLLSFETTPAGATPVDNSSLTTPYSIAGGTVRFFFDTNGNNTFDEGTDLNPVFEEAGVDSIRGFASNFNFGEDTARPGYESRLGSFFLRQPSFPFGSFMAQYETTTPITELSGEIWDIDGDPLTGTEQWRVDVLNHSGGVLATLLSPAYADFSASSLDSLPWTFEFHSLPAGVEKVRLTFVGTKTTGIGLGFNNFSPDVAVPEPAAIVLMSGIALMLFSAGRLRRRGAGGRT